MNYGIIDARKENQFWCKICRVVPIGEDMPTGLSGLDKSKKRNGWSGETPLHTGRMCLLDPGKTPRD